ncbi:Major intrinsic protein domain containing protein [Trichostrongylus colubriformis]|uniref:Major intrinsic protein domain containing protein n=1 Tax=Trichostrongylus colubriformis TaxID=6319 RepID=A0AAN8FAN1_TRICO
MEAIFYIISQMVGAIAGSLVVRAVLSSVQYVAIQGGATLCAANTMWYQGLIAETLATFFLVQTVLLTAVDNTTVLAPLAIGFTVLMDIMAVGAISGASMNPARSFGPNIVATIFMHDKLAANFWSYHFIYYLGPVFGALLAVALYKVFFAKDERIV